MSSAEYANADQLCQTLAKVSNFGAPSRLKSYHDQRRSSANIYNGNYQEMLDYARSIGYDAHQEEDVNAMGDFVPVQDARITNYNKMGSRARPKCTGRGRIIEEAALYAENFHTHNKQQKMDRDVQEQLEMAGCRSMSVIDEVKFFDSEFKKKKEDANECQQPNTTEEIVEEKVQEEEKEEIVSRKNALKPVKTEVYVPPHRRKEESVSNPADESSKTAVDKVADGLAEIAFCELIRRAEEKESPILSRRKKVFEDDYDSDEVDFINFEPDAAAPVVVMPKAVDNVGFKSRNAVLMQFQSRCFKEEEIAKRADMSETSLGRVDSTLSSIERASSSASDAFYSLSDDGGGDGSTSPAASGWSLPSSSSESFCIDDNSPSKPRLPTLGDFIVKPKKKKKSTSPKKSS